MNQEVVTVDDEVETVIDTVTEIIADDVTGIDNDFTKVANQEPVQNQDTGIVEAGVDDIAELEDESDTADKENLTEELKEKYSRPLPNTN